MINTIELDAGGGKEMTQTLVNSCKVRFSVVLSPDS